MGKQNTQKQNIRFGRTNSLFTKTLFRMIPFIFLAGISTFLISVVDGLMVGNADGSKALAAVSAMGPFLTIVGAITAVVHSGVSIVLPQLEGENDTEKELGGYRATFISTIAIAAAVAVLQIPVAAMIINSMGFTPDVSREAWAYSIGLFLSNPIDCISTVGTFVLISTGNARYMLMLSVVEGLTDLIIDYITVFQLNMGPLGAGLGTAAGIWIRCIITLFLLKRKTRFFMFKKQEYKETAGKMLKAGIPAGFRCLINAVLAWIFSWLIMDALGIDGMNVKAVLGFIASLASILLSSVMRSATTIIGFRNGIRDYHGVTLSFRRTVSVIVLFMLILTCLCTLYPLVPFYLYGIQNIPGYGTLAVRAMAFSLPFMGCNALAGYYYQLKNKEKRVIILDFLESLMIPVVTAFVARYVLGNEFIWLGYLAGSIGVFIINAVLIGIAMKDEKAKRSDCSTISLSLTKENVSELSADIGTIVKKWNLPRSTVNRLSMIIEEITAYSHGYLSESRPDTDLLITITKEGIKVVTIDDGIKITELDDEHISSRSESEFTNYDVLKSISGKLTYQRIMNTNVITVFCKHEIIKVARKNGESCISILENIAGTSPAA